MKDLAKSVVENPKLFGAILAVIAGLVLFIVKFYRKGMQVEVPESVVIFDENLKLYLETLKKGENNIEILDNLIESIERLQNEEINHIVETNTIDFSELLKSIRQYTAEFAKANNYEYNEKDYKTNNIVDFNNYLKLQKKIIKNKAS